MANNSLLANCLLDTGPLVALLVKNDKNHARAKAIFGKLKAPLLTSESVISEACFLVSKVHELGPSEILKLGNQGLYKIAFDLQRHLPEAFALIAKYKNVPMSLADASLVRLATLHNQPFIATFDSDFDVYRWGKNKKFRMVS